MRDDICFRSTPSEVQESLKKSLGVTLNNKHLILMDSNEVALKFHACHKNGKQPYILEPTTTHDRLKWALLAFYDTSKEIEFFIYPVKRIRNRHDRLQRLNPKTINDDYHVGTYALNDLDVDMLQQKVTDMIEVAELSSQELMQEQEVFEQLEFQNETDDLAKTFEEFEDLNWEDISRLHFDPKLGELSFETDLMSATDTPKPMQVDDIVI